MIVECTRCHAPFKVDIVAAGARRQAPLTSPSVHNLLVRACSVRRDAPEGPMPSCPYEDASIEEALRKFGR